MTEAAPSPDFQEAIEAGDWDRVEELWLEALDRQPIPTADLMEARRRLWKEGRKTLARTLLELLAETAEEIGDADAALHALRELVRLSDKPGAALKQRLARAVSEARAGQPSVAAVLAHLPVTDSRRPLETLQAIETWLDHDLGTIVLVHGQGVGRVCELNLELGNLKVDVGSKKPVSIPFGAVTRFVTRLPEGHFLRAKIEEPEALAARVADDPEAGLVHLLESLDRPADVATIKEALEGVIEPAAWTSWWAKARKSARVLSSGSGSRLSYSVTRSVKDAVDTLLEDLGSRDSRTRLKAAKDLAARGGDAARRAADALAGTLDGLADSDPGAAWETAALLASLPAGAEAAGRCTTRLAGDANPLRLLSGIRDRSQRQQALDRIRELRSEEWPEVWAEWMLHERSVSILDRIAAALDGSGRDAVLDSTLETIFRNHREHPAQFIWAAEAMTGERAPDALRRRLRPSLLEKIPDALTGREFADLRNRAKGLLEGGKAAIRVLLEYATPQQAERFSQRVARIDAVDPGQLRLVEQAALQATTATRAEEAAESALFVATREAIDSKKAELKQLVDVDIPRTLKGINAAAAEGDLRENFEYHMLRDRQELQSARAAKLQEDLVRVRVLEPGSAPTGTVNVGTVVELEGIGGESVDPVTILGPWDADLERRIFANGTELAKGLLGRSVGDTVEVDGVEARITRIAAWPREG
jgi:transcription elongation factor GreA